MNRLLHPCVCLRAFGLCVLLVASVLRAETYELKAFAPGVEPPFFGAELGVLTATQTAQDLWFRVGVRNVTPQDYAASRPVREEDIKLTAFHDGKKLETSPTTVTLSDMFPAHPLRPGERHVGTLTFPWGTKRYSPDAIGAMELRVPGFPVMVLRLDPQKVVAPIEWAKVAKLSHLNLDVVPKVEQLAIFPMRLLSMAVRENDLEIALSFRNAHRLPVEWKGSLSGQRAVLITNEDEWLSPSEVSESLKVRLAPSAGAWQPGEDNVGWVRFPLPQAQAARRLTFALPGYGLVHLSYDDASHEWKPSVETANEPAKAPQRVAALLDEEKAFAHLKTFWDGATSELQRRSWSSFLKRFRGTAREDQRLFVERWQRAPIASAEFRLSELQKVTPDAEGRLRSVRVELHYTLATLPKENLFITHAECDMQRDAEGEWHVDFVNYVELQPFWMLGYTETLSTEHFLIFHQPNEANAAQAQLASKQLEKGYARLLRTGLTLKPRYAAFSIGVKNDFEKLTGRDPMTFSGGASSGYVFHKNGVGVINEALYLNDFRFFTLQRAWGKQDRQITILHELVHLALADYTRPWTPGWLCEGTAMYFADQVDSTTRSFLHEKLLPVTTLPELTKLAYLGEGGTVPLEAQVQYQFSGQTVAWIVKHYGEKGLLQLYAAFATNAPDEWRTYRSNQRNSLIAASRLRIARRTLEKLMPGMTLEALDAEVRASIKR